MKINRSLLALAPILLSWAALHAAEDKMEFRYSYFPSYGKLRYMVVSPPEGAAAWRMVLTAEGAAKTLAEDAGDFPFPAIGRTVDVPDLPAGKYELALTVSTAGGQVTKSGSFVRGRFDWEAAKLGADPSVIIPPYTPLEVDRQGGAVGCIGRTYRMGSGVLWEQVLSQGRELLAGPVRIDLSIGGATHSPRQADENDPVQFTDVRPHKVTAGSDVLIGPVKGHITVEYDYDGMALVTLRLRPCEKVIDAGSLVIPMKASEAWLMHPVTDVLRHHYAGKIPSGEGKVWDSSRIPRSQLPGPFVPYIWIGGPERGICWFADNDRDWLVDREANKPALEIIRDGGAVRLLVNFITKPSALTRERTIVFGLQATPAKPMPTKPYSFRRWWSLGAKADDDLNFNFLGAGLYWGTREAFVDYVPVDNDYAIFEEMAKARRTGEYDADFIDKWLAKHYPKADQEQLNTYRAHLRAGLGTSARTPFTKPGDSKVRLLMPYTSARSMGWSEGARTFIDEWTIYDIADPRWARATKSGTRLLRQNEARFVQGAGPWYETDPVPSYVDYALWGEKKMYETWADGVYYDNYFLHANYNIVPGPGYVDDDGVIRPGVNLLAFREFSRRTAVLQHKMGKMPFQWIHMTNVNIVPMLSFAQATLDWEWRDTGKYALMDMQDRLEVDGDTSLILAMSTGLQAGNIGVGIDRVHPPAGSGVKREWLIRTMLAVTLPHEMKTQVWDAAWAADLMNDFGYGLDDCKVYRYWDEAVPVAVSGGCVKPLLLVRGKQAMIVLGSFDNACECTVKLDLDRLSLPETVRASNMENGEAIEATGPGEFKLTMPKHDVRFVLVR